MGKTRDFNWFRFYSWLGIAVIAALVIGYAATSAYCFIEYGGMPVDEIPFWALWFMFGGGGR